MGRTIFCVYHFPLFFRKGLCSDTQYYVSCARLNPSALKGTFPLKGKEFKNVRKHQECPKMSGGRHFMFWVKCFAGEGFKEMSGVAAFFV